MKIVLIILIVFAMGYYIYKQRETIAILQGSLDDKNAKVEDLHKKLENAVKADVKAVNGTMPGVNFNRGGLPPVGPQPTSHPTNWMWDQKNPLDAPAKSGR